MKKFLKTIAIIFGVLLLFIAFVALGSPSWFIPTPNTPAFTHVIRDNVSPDARVIDIAMLGAHNSFSHGIGTFSAIDPNDDSPGATGITAVIAPGVTARFGRNQFSGAEGLLYAGVRYFDVRVTYDNGWYTENTPISNPLQDLIAFLQNNPGELIIFDVAYVRTGTATPDDFWNHISGIVHNGNNLFDFVHIDAMETALQDITLSTATNGGASGGVIMFVRYEDIPTEFAHLVYDRRTNVRRQGHSQRNSVGSISRISAEHDLLLRHLDGEVIDGVNFANRLRVSQSQIQPALGGAELINSLLGWSYMRINMNHNSVLIEEDISRWLTSMPIFMVGFAESPRNDFNERVIEIINAYSRENN